MEKHGNGYHKLCSSWYIDNFNSCHFIFFGSVFRLSINLLFVSNYYVSGGNVAAPAEKGEEKNLTEHHQKPRKMLEDLCIKKIKHIPTMLQENSKKKRTEKK